MRVTASVRHLLRIVLFSLGLLVLSTSVNAAENPLTVTYPMSLASTTAPGVAALTVLNITNNLPIPIPSLTFKLSGTGGTFTALSNTCGNLAAGATCAFTGSFTPSASGTNTAGVTIVIPRGAYSYSQTTNTSSAAINAQMWGDNNYGQLGNNTSGTNTGTPGHVVSTSGSGTLTEVAQLAGGYTENGASTCALLTTGQVNCWGQNGWGELGDNAQEDTSNSPVTVCAVGTTGSCSSTSGALSGATSIAGGGEFNCAVTGSGSNNGAVCWGLNAQGQLGNKGVGTNQSVPVQVCDANDTDCTATLTGVKAVSAGGGEFVCALMNNGTVNCWGVNNNYGTLGNNSTSNSSTPVTVCAVGATDSDCSTTDPLENVTAIAVGGEHVCALINDGTVDCWGSNDEGQLGYNGQVGTVSLVPVQVVSTSGSGTLTGVAAIAASGYSSCALLNNGEVNCWGDNSYGELGQNTGGTAGDNTTYPGIVCGVNQIDCTTNPLGSVTAIMGGQNHFCALISGGTMDCWGNNADGELGQGLVGEPDYNSVPLEVDGLGDNTVVGLMPSSDETSGAIIISAGQRQAVKQGSK